MEKKPWASKTLWVNIIGIAVIVIQGYTGFIVSPELQVIILGAINAVLRLVTKKEIVWS